MKELLENYVSLKQVYSQVYTSKVADITNYLLKSIFYISLVKYIQLIRII